MSKIKCPCKSGKFYQACCGRFIESSETPKTAKALMRSRYTAYTLAKIDYIVATQMGAARDGFDKIEALQWAKSVKWLKLNIKRDWFDETSKAKAFVEFKAYFQSYNGREILHEISAFEKYDGVWFYIGKMT